MQSGKVTKLTCLAWRELRYKLMWKEKERIAEFIKRNINCGAVIQLKEANERKDRSAFSWLLYYIKRAIELEYHIVGLEVDIEYHQEMIKKCAREIRITKNEIKNCKNYHKIKSIRESNNDQTI